MVRKVRSDSGYLLFLFIRSCKYFFPFFVCVFFLINLICPFFNRHCLNVRCRWRSSEGHPEGGIGSHVEQVTRTADTEEDEAR